MQRAKEARDDSRTKRDAVRFALCRDRTQSNIRAQQAALEEKVYGL